MQGRWMGRTGVRVSKIAMGTMGFGPDPATDEAIYGRCLEAGVTLFDCADVYQGGDSELALGRLIRETDSRDDIVLATKAYFPTRKDGPNDRGTSRYHLVRAVEASLQRLQTDRIDVFYLHRFDDQTALDETLRGLEDLVRAGSILYPAVSNFAAWQVQAALGCAALNHLSPVVAVQPMYNLVKRQAEVEILPMCAANGLAVFPYNALAGGLLTGKYSGGARPPGARLTEVAMYSRRYSDPSVFGVADAFVALAREVGVHPVTLAVAWVADHPAVTASLVGAGSIGQLEPALAAGDLTLDPELRARISALSPEPPPATDRNEERTSTNYGVR